MADSASVTKVAASTSSTTLQAANDSRVGLVIYNSGATLYVKLGDSASTTDYTVQLAQDDFYELPRSFKGEVYSGKVTGIWDTATGDAYVTEIT